MQASSSPKSTVLERPHDALFDCPFLSARIYTICAYSAIPSIPYPTARPRLSLSTSSASLSENAGITVNRSATFERSDRSDLEVVTRECSCADSGEGRAEGKLAIGGFRGKRSKLSSIWSQVGRRSFHRVGPRLTLISSHRFAARPWLRATRTASTRTATKSSLSVSRCTSPCAAEDDPR